MMLMVAVGQTHKKTVNNGINNKASDRILLHYPCSLTCGTTATYIITTGFTID